LTCCEKDVLVKVDSNALYEKPFEFLTCKKKTSAPMDEQDYWYKSLCGFQRAALVMVTKQLERSEGQR
jgi:hypothetical protein